MATDLIELGQRIAHARNDARLTQAEAAAGAALDRSSLAKIETGKRRVSALELAKLAEVLGQRVEWFLTPAPQAIVSRRSHAPGEPSPALDRMIERLAREVEFVQGQGDVLSLRQPPDELRPFTDDAAAERAAGIVRGWLGLDAAEPVWSLDTLVSPLGLLAFSLELGDEAADGGCLLLADGAIALVNGSRQVGRRRLTLAHELGHYLLADEFSVDWRVSADDAGKRERLIDRFARALFLPREGLSPLWRSLVADHGTRIAAVRTASEYRVDMATLGRRLLDLRLEPHEVADRVRSVRTNEADIIEFDLVVAHEMLAPRLPRPYEKAVLALYKSEVVSGDRALELLLDTMEADDLPELARLPEDAIWKFVS
jgi:Zn-dependent peptidase ImmA (M78 family)/transcriptional regulator with XRE-family HTH domain